MLQFKTIKRIYLDVCTLCRPCDDQDAMRIRLETDAYYLILQAVQNKKYELIVSPVHLEELTAIEDIQERYEILALLRKYGIMPEYDIAKAKERAEYLYNKKLGVADAAHIAFAEAFADCFISCDDKLIKKCKIIKINLLVVNPVQFIMKEDLK